MTIFDTFWLFFKSWTWATLIDLCHNCFFVGRTAKGHKAEHPVQEYCTSTGRSANFKILGQAIRNSFRTKKYFKKKQGKLGYLPVGSLCDGHTEFSPNINSRNLEVKYVPGGLGSTCNDGGDDLEEDKPPVDEHSLIAEYCRIIKVISQHFCCAPSKIF